MSGSAYTWAAVVYALGGCGCGLAWLAQATVVPEGWGWAWLLVGGVVGTWFIVRFSEAVAMVNRADRQPDPPPDPAESPGKRP